MSFLTRLAASDAVPTFLASGTRGGRAIGLALLSRNPGLRLVDSPRQATVLLVVGALPAPHLPALRQLHDQLPHPRAAVWWGGSTTTDQLAGVDVLAPDAPMGDVARTIVRLHRSLLDGTRDSAPHLGPSEHPVAWQGAGDHGQGGEGMMGGTPYGRPMAMTGPDPRDGLQLDRLRLVVGPYLTAWWPPALILDLEMQGDVVARAAVSDAAPGRDGMVGSPPTSGGEVDEHRRVLSDVCRSVGSGALAQRVLRGPEVPVTAIRRLLRGLPRGVARVTETQSSAVSPGRRALLQGDVHDRVEGRLDLVAAAPKRPAARMDDSGEDAAVVAALLPDLLPGLAWDELAPALASLDLELGAPARVPDTAVGS